jgi:hypothetical protein
MSRIAASRPVLPNVPPGPMNGLLIGERVEDAWLGHRWDRALSGPKSVASPSLCCWSGFVAEGDVLGQPGTPSRGRARAPRKGCRGRARGVGGGGALFT